MDEVFRFLFLRPPAPGTAVEIQPGEQFGNRLRAANDAQDRKAALKAAANELITSQRGITSLTQLNFGTALLATETALAALDDPTPEDVTAAVQATFNNEPNGVVNTPEWGHDRDRLADNLIAAKLLSGDQAVEAKRIEALLRLMAVIRRVAEQDASLAAPGAIRAALAKPTQIGPLFGSPRRDLPPDIPPPPLPGPDPELESARARARLLEGLVTVLTRVEPSSFAIPQTPPTQPTAPQEDAMGFLREQLVAKIKAIPVEQIETGPTAAVAAELRSVQASTRTIAAPLPAAPRFVLTAEAVRSLSASHQEALRSLGLDVTKTPLPKALEAINDELGQFYGKIAAAETREAQVTLLGSHLYDLTKLNLQYEPDWVGLAPSVPSSHGTVKPVGIGDLLIVRQQLKRYQGGEVADIANILKGEFKKREHRRALTTETTVTTEEETKKEEERDNQTTERFELQREASEVIKDDTQFKAGLQVSGSYGPTIEFKASTDFSMDHAKEESTKTATRYSKEVTSRASSKISERHRVEQILKTIEVFEEKNEHGFDNTKGDGHVVGIYQWVDKVYEAQVFNYGQRMMFDIMVPEPAAFWIYANANKARPGATLKEPEPFTKRPDELTKENYPIYVNQYQVSDVKPPPEPFQTVSKTFDGRISRDDGNGTKVSEVPIPVGYEAVNGHAIATGAYWMDIPNEWTMMVGIGKNGLVRWSGTDINLDCTLDLEQGSVGLGIYVSNLNCWVVTIEIDCRRTARSLEQWKLDTHAAIMQAYLKQERDYQEQQAALQVQAANEIQGRNPLENRMIERAELKKHAISIITAQTFGLFGAITQSKHGYPELMLQEADAEGRYIRFFEQAFEWEHMMYLFYPYFWGRKGNWLTRALLDDTDPQFAEFLKAGSARVVVPVRLGFHGAIAHFMETGEIWEGADPPTLTSPLYVSIIDEIKEREQAPGTEVPQGDPWEVKLPTQLVKLRTDNKLPSWHKQPDGTWAED